MATPVALDNTLGSMLIGLVVAAMLNGVAIVQVYYYFTHQSDPRHLKLLVGTVITLDTIHQALITHTVYTYTVTNFGNLAGFKSVVWSNSAGVVFNALIALLVQSFLTLRVWRCSNHSKLLTGVIVLFVIAEFVTILMATAWSFQWKTYERLVGLRHFNVGVNAITVAGDSLIAASLCFFLHRSRTGLSRSDTMIDKLILFTVGTGLLPSICAIFSLIFLLVAKRTFIFIGFFFCIGRLYTNCLLVTLNARKKLLAAGSAAPDRASDDISLSKTEFSNSVGVVGRGPKIDTQQEFSKDRTGEP